MEASAVGKLYACGIFDVEVASLLVSVIPPPIAVTAIITITIAITITFVITIVQHEQLQVECVHGAYVQIGGMQSADSTG